MALPKMTCPISQARVDQLKKYMEERESAEIQNLWENEQEDILKDVESLKSLRKLAKYGIPDTPVLNQIRVINPDLMIEWMKTPYLEGMMEAKLDDEASWRSVDLKKYPLLGECVTKILDTLTSTALRIPVMILKGATKRYIPVRGILLTENSINHIFEAEKVYFQYHQNCSKEINNRSFWKDIIYRRLFDVESYYTSEENFKDTEIKCNLAQYLKTALKKFISSDTVNEINYFCPALGQQAGLCHSDQIAIVFFLVKNPESDSFEQGLKNLRMRNYETRTELYHDIEHSSVFRTLANKPKGKLWLKYFSLAEIKMTDQTTYSKESVAKALQYMKSVYNSHWYSTMQSPDLSGIGIIYPNLNRISVYTSFFAKTKIFQELLPWLAMIKCTVNASSQVHDLQDLHTDYPELSAYNGFRITFGIQDYHDCYQSTIELKASFDNPVCAVGTRYFNPENLEFRAYTGNWDPSTVSVLGQAHSYFEKMPLLTEVINDLSVEIRKFEKALDVINNALTGCRKAFIGEDLLQTEEDKELEEMIWDGLRDYFEAGEDPMVPGFELATSILNPFMA